MRLQALSRDLERRGHRLVDLDAFFEHRDRRSDELGPGLLLRSKRLVELVEPRDASWDADRLDLPRVGITPDPRFLSSSVDDWTAWIDQLPSMESDWSTLYDRYGAFA